MSKTKAPRKKKHNPIEGIRRQVNAVLSDTLSKFYVMGDMNHNPMSFHTSRVNMLLKGTALTVGLQEMTKFLYGERRLWQLAVFHFFKVDENIEVIPAFMRFEDSLLNEVGDAVDQYIQLSKEAVLQSEQEVKEEDYLFYGYYINHGEDLRLDWMEADIIGALFKINNDLDDVNPEVCVCTAEKILRAVAGEKFSLVNSNSLKTRMVEEKDNATIN